jgi:hypothetical protein
VEYGSLRISNKTGSSPGETNLKLLKAQSNPMQKKEAFVKTLP